MLFHSYYRREWRAAGTVCLGVWLCACGRAPVPSREFLPADDPRAAEMVFVPAGPFRMGSSESAISEIQKSYGGERVLYENEYPERTVDLEAYYIDRHEVTQAEYKHFLDETGREPPFVESVWATPFNWEGRAYPDGLADHPVVLVSYFDALDYCHWARKTLPSEAEWEKAARGVHGSIYPWGEEWDSSRLNSAASWAGRELPTIDIWKEEWWSTIYHNQLRGKIATTKPVGSYPSGASPYGALDMSGNVFEWIDAWYDLYPGSKVTNPEFGQQYRVVRGGDWYLGRIFTRTPARLRAPPDHKVTTIGFRCVCRKADGDD